MSKQSLPPIIRSRTSVGRPLNVLGDRQTVLLGSEDTGGAFSLIDQENPPGFQVPLNLHQVHDETNFVISGEIEFQIETETRRLRPGDSIHIPRGNAHRFRVVGEVSARMLLLFHPGGLEELFRELAAAFPPGVQPDVSELNQICGRYQTQVLEI